MALTLMHEYQGTVVSADHGTIVINYGGAETRAVAGDQALIDGLVAGDRVRIYTDSADRITGISLMA